MWFGGLKLATVGVFTPDISTPTDEGNIISESQVLNIYQHTTTQNQHLEKLIQN